ncbi:MAG: N-acetylmuramoyl-L-alanine amidase [Candidatus Omnitrophica bacterium]|nr:N-acetylmuramoyl-L-alanine amidase [Candidatus Omnitrophota bacterium]
MVIRLFLTAICLIFLSGCAATPFQRLEKKDLVLKDLCARYGFSCTMDSVTQLIKLKRKGFEARGLIGSSTVVVDGKDVYLSRPINISKGIVYVPFDFEQQVMILLSKKAGPSAKAFQKIIIDAGHGGKDPGAITLTGTQEKDIVLDIANRLSDALKKRGAIVLQTRDTDEFLSLEQRVEVARSENADLFMSIHANIASNSGVEGLETYYLGFLGQEDKKEICCVEKHKKMFQKYKMEQSDDNVKKVLLDMLYAYKQQSSGDIARHLSRYTAERITTRDRGGKTANFYVLKNTLIPAILVEVGFLSNQKEEQKLKNSSYRQQIAESLADGLMQYKQ